MTRLRHKWLPPTPGSTTPRRLDGVRPGARTSAKADEVRQSHERHRYSHCTKRDAGVAVEHRKRELDLRPNAVRGAFATAPACRAGPAEPGEEPWIAGVRAPHAIVDLHQLVARPCAREAQDQDAGEQDISCRLWSMTILIDAWGGRPIRYSCSSDRWPFTAGYRGAGPRMVV